MMRNGETGKTLIIVTLIKRLYPHYIFCYFSRKNKTKQRKQTNKKQHMLWVLIRSASIWIPQHIPQHVFLNEKWKKNVNRFLLKMHLSGAMIYVCFYWIYAVNIPICTNTPFCTKGVGAMGAIFITSLFPSYKRYSFCKGSTLKEKILFPFSQNNLTE